jgi:hypothetical protein
MSVVLKRKKPDKVKTEKENSEAKSRSKEKADSSAFF